MDFITSREDLRTLYKQPGDGAIRKELPALDAHARRFLERSPFVLIGSSDQDGNGDVTPKGDRPGFVAILDDRTLAIPDRPGNNRLDTWENIVANPAVGLLFLIPGMNETLRINGIGRITADADLCNRLAVDGRPSISALVVDIRASYMHCAKAFMRSALWKPETWPARQEMPTLGEMLRDQLALSVAADVIDRDLDDAYKKSLW